MAERLSRAAGARRRKGRRRRLLGRELRQARTTLSSLGAARTSLAKTIEDYRRRSQETSRRLNTFVSNAEIAMIRTSAEGLIESWSDAAEALFGYSSDEVLGRPITLLAPAGEAEQLSPLLEKARRGEPLAGMDAVLLGKGGISERVSLSVNPARDSKGAVVGALFSARERRGGADAQGADLVQSSDDAIVSQTLDGIITGWNKGAEWIYGYRAEEVLRQPISILAPPNRTDNSFRILERIARGERVEHYETERVRKDGKPIVVSVTASPIVDSKGRIVGASAISRDITERKQAEDALVAKTQQLARVNAELELFTSAAAHDLQEPLRRILLIASRLESKSARLARPARHDVKRIEAAALRMRRLARGLLEYSEAATAELRFAPVDLAAAARAAAAEFRPRLKAARGKLVIGKLAAVRGDASQLRRLLAHLIENALKFRGPKSRPVIKISTRALAGGWTRLAVQDNGPGIEPQYHQKVFEPFKRLHSGDVFEGAGLGLSICRRIMWRHGGRMELTSAPGKGATFAALFPPEPGKGSPDPNRIPFKKRATATVNDGFPQGPAL